MSILTLSFVSSLKLCDKLSNGRYEVEFNSVPFKTYENYQIIILDSAYTKYFENGDSTTGKIKWLTSGYLILNAINRAKQDSSSELDKYLQKSFGQAIIELQNCTFDTLVFRTTCSAQLHLTLNSGKFIRLK